MVVLSFSPVKCQVCKNGGTLNGYENQINNTVADPGFFRRRGTPILEGVRQSIIGQIFAENYENERNWNEMGRASLALPPNWFRQCNIDLTFSPFLQRLS